MSGRFGRWPAVASDPLAFTSHTFDLDGQAYRYLDEGSGHPVVMVHGNPTWSFYYRRLVTALRPSYRAIAPDHIGMGRSDTPPRSTYRYTLAQRVDDLTRFLDSLDLDQRVTLVLHDWGGMIGMAWATANSDRVARLVLLNTAAFPLLPGRRLPLPLHAARVPVLGAVAVRGANAFAIGATHLAMTRRRMPAETRRAYRWPYRSWTERVAVHQFVRDIPVRASDPAYPIVSATAERLGVFVDTPTLICWGMRDFVFDAGYLAEWERRLPGAEVHRLADAGHYVLEDAPDLVLPRVQEFLIRTTAATTRT